MAGRETSVAKWPEANLINGYAAALASLAMLVKGFGILVVTWTTVVLLGGFVSVLQKKDFWSLTVITFIQIAGVIGNSQDEKWISAGATGQGMAAMSSLYVRGLQPNTMQPRIFFRVMNIVTVVIGYIAWLVQVVTFVVLYACGCWGIFMWGNYIATGISLWRLNQHDYGNADDASSKANMTAALDVLYIIVVVQGAIFAYTRVITAHASETIVAKVAKAYGLRVDLVWGYLNETHQGCVKNLSYIKGRNLVTYAVDLMGPDNTPQDYLSGLQILSTILGPLYGEKKLEFEEQRMLIRQLILYGPSNHIFRFLLALSNTGSRPYGGEEREIWKHAARIVAHVADGASLELLPQVIQCMSSLLGTMEGQEQFFPSNSSDYDIENMWGDYLDQVWQGLHVLFVLGEADENNCRLIIHTRGLLTKIMTPLASNIHHQAGHIPWDYILVESLRVIHLLTAAYGHGEGETGAKLFREIENNLEVDVAEAMMRIIRCDKCREGTQTLAMGIVTNLHMMQTPKREHLIEMLADIYTYTDANPTRIQALEALATLCCKDRSNAAIILQVNGSAIYSFTKDLEALSDGYQRHHISVAEILEHACLHYTRDDECLRILKESMTDVMPKVLNEILTAEATQASQQGSDLQDDGSSLEEHDIQKIQTALLSLCVTVHETFINADHDLALQFDGAMHAHTPSLLTKLSEMVVRNNDPTASCLAILKLTCRMGISMMKCRGRRYSKQDFEIFFEALSTPFVEAMHGFDMSMEFARGDDTVKPRKPERCLGPICSEAAELLANYAELDVMAPSTVAGRVQSSN